MPVKKIFPIKKSADFQVISKSGIKFHSNSLTLITAESKPNLLYKNPEFCRVGFTVSKTVSKSAVKRNLAKRRLREVARALMPESAKQGYDYVIIARREILQNSFSKISQDFAFCLRKIHQPRTSSYPSNPAKSRHENKPKASFEQALKRHKNQKCQNHKSAN